MGLFWGPVGHLSYLWGAVRHYRTLWVAYGAPWVAYGALWVTYGAVWVTYGALWGCPTGAPCLSLDVVRDDLGDDRETLPLSVLLCAGTQAATAQGNRWGAP